MSLSLIEKHEELLRQREVATRDLDKYKKDLSEAESNFNQTLGNPYSLNQIYASRADKYQGHINFLEKIIRGIDDKLHILKKEEPTNEK